MRRSLVGISLIALSLAIGACSATLRSYPLSPVPSDDDKQQAKDKTPAAQQIANTPESNAENAATQTPPTANADDAAKDIRVVALMDEEGLIYRLPKYLFRITSTPQPLQDSPPADNSGGGGNGNGQATMSTPPADDGADDEGKDKKKKLEGEKPKPESKPKAKADEGDDAGTQEAPPGPAELLKVTFPQDGKCPAVEIKVVGPIVVADDRPNASFVLQHDSSAFRSDTIGLTLTSEGLLQSADSQSTGELDTVAKILAQIVFAAVTGVPAPLTPTPQAEQSIQGTTECAPQTKQFRTFDFDPTKQVSFDITKWEAIKTISESLPNLKEYEGVYYRSIAPTLIELSGGFSNYSINQAFTVMAPTGSIGKLEFVGSLISDGNGTTVKFSKGIPISYDRVNKSEAVAVASLPLDILNAFLQLPLNVLTFRFEEIKKEREISDEELKIIQNLFEMKKAQSGEEAETE